MTAEIESAEMIFSASDNREIVISKLGWRWDFSQLEAEG
jgi:hypothetical protein